MGSRRQLLNLQHRQSGGPPSDVDPDTKAFVEDMNDNWDHRRGKKAAAAEPNQETQLQLKDSIFSTGKISFHSLERVKRDYRVKKQRVNAGLWMKEFEKMEESKLADSVLGGGGADDIERLLDSASEIFDSTNNDVNNSQIINSSEFKNKPDGWETTAKGQDGNIWEMSQREGRHHTPRI